MKSDIIRLCLEFYIILKEQNEEYLEYNKNEEESILEMILNKKMEAYFLNLYEAFRYEKSVILLLSRTDPGLLSQFNITDDEIIKMKNLALEELHG